MSDAGENTLVEAIGGLSASEIQSFRKWLQSPVFTKRSILLTLFDHIQQCLHQEETIKQENIGTLLQTKDDKKIRREMSELLDHLRDFWCWTELKKDKARRELYVLRAASRRGLGKNFTLAGKAAKKALQEIGEASLEKPLKDFLFEMEQYHWDLSQKRGQLSPFERLTEKLNAWYAAQLLQLSCMDQAQRAVQRQGDRETPSWIMPLIRQLPSSVWAQTPALELYHCGYVMLAQPDENEHMSAFHHLLEKYANQLPLDEARGLLMLAINHGIRRINQGNTLAIRQTRDFYMLGLESNLLQDERGILSKYTYNNALMTFLALSEWEASLQFLEKYRLQLAATERENVYRYNLSIFHFRRGAYDACLEILRDVGFSDPMYNLESRKMLLRIYYEQQAFDALESLLESLLTWLRRHGELGYHRDMYRNLAIFTGRLLRMAPGDREGRKRLAQKVRETPLVAERSWLLGKINP